MTMALSLNKKLILPVVAIALAAAGW